MVPATQVLQPKAGIAMAWKRTEAHGGSGGLEFSDDLTEVRELAGFNIRAGVLVDGLQPVFRMCDGSEKVGPWHGGPGGDLERIDFKPGETLVSVKGRSGSFIDQLKFITTAGETPIYGGNGGAPFEMDITKAGGFFGRSGSWLDSIGFFIPC